MRGRNVVAGFTLIEMMVVVLVLAITASIAVPSFSRLIAVNAVKAAGQELYSLLQYARGEAVSRGQSVTVSASASDTWSSTLDVLALNNGDSVTLRHYESLNQANVTAIASEQALSELTFYSNGSSSGSTEIKLCNITDTSISGWLISVARSGQVTAPESIACE